MSERTWTGDPVPVPERSQAASALPGGCVRTDRTVSLRGYGGRVVKRTTTTRSYDAAGRLVREEVVVEELDQPWTRPLPLPVPPYTPWWQQPWEITC